MPPRVRRAHLLTMVVTVLVATSFPVGAAITHGLDSLVLTLLRFVLATLLFAPLVAWRYGLSMPRLGDLARYGALSACLVGFFWGMFEALRFTSALNTATIFTLVPAIAAVFAAILAKEKLGGASRVALLVGIVGAVWVIFRGDFGAFMTLSFNRGDAIFLAATCAMGLYVPLIKLLHRGEPLAQMTLWTLATGVVWLMILSFGRLSEIAWAAVPAAVYGGIVYLAIFTTLITFFLTQWCTTVLGATKVMSYTYFNPALVLAIGLLLGDQAPRLATYPGLVLLVGAIFILQRAKHDA